MKRRSLVFIALALGFAMSFFITLSFNAVPASASAKTELPFTLTAPRDLVLTKENAEDRSAVLGVAYGKSNEINEFFTACDDYGDQAAYLRFIGVTDYDDISLQVQIDWALDDTSDEISG